MGNTSMTDGKLRHSRGSKILVFTAGTVLFLFFIISLFLDEDVTFTETMETSASPEEVIVAVADLHNWKTWSVWNDEYYQAHNAPPIYETNFEGEAVRSIEQQEAGDSQQVYIIERQKKTKKQVVFQYSLWEKKESKDSEGSPGGSPLIKAMSRFVVTPLISSTGQYKVEWSYMGDYSSVMGINPLQKYFLLFTEYSLKRAYRQSLDSLKKQLEAEKETEKK